MNVVEPMGNETFVYFQLDGIQFISRLRAYENLFHGNIVKLFMQVERIYFFDKETGNNIS